MEDEQILMSEEEPNHVEVEAEDQDKEEFDKIVQLFSKDLQQHMRRKQPSDRQKKIPKHLQQKISEGTNLYTFGRYDEAILFFE